MTFRFSRRSFVASASAATVLAFRPGLSFAAALGGEDAKLDALFTRIFNDQLLLAPEQATSLGLDKGVMAGLRSKLGDDSAAGRAASVAQTRASLADLAKINDKALSDAMKVNLDVVRYQLERRLDGPRFGIDNPQSPYRITQRFCSAFNVPDFLDSTHPMNSVEDAEAYLARLAQLATAIDDDIAEQREQAGRGILAPAWTLDLALGQLAKLREPAPGESSMVKSIVRRTATKGISGQWQQRAETIVRDAIYPAIDRQIALLEQLKPTTVAGDGAWRIPRGDEIYAAALAQATTTNFTPEEVHQIGLEQVAELTAQLDVVLKAAGYTKGTVGERLAALNTLPEQLYANTPESRAELIASLNAGVKKMNALLPRAFATLPDQPLDIRAVPVEIQDGAANGYYYSASLDGSRPAIYWINLKEVSDWPKYTLPSLTYHEGTPGHHLQISLAQRSDSIPLIRKTGGFSAYSEGWALYSEQVADELGAYDGIEKAGYLQSFLFRATRLVVDTGIHSKRWSREKATDYMVATTGFTRPRTLREVERYCTMIGQACSYKIGHIAWTRAREKAQKALGAKFDIKQFHEVLLEGAMPLSILEKRIEERTAAALKA
ncbi:Tat pathway signal protein [Novosphingobium sp. AAP83]|uniref:DUF885 domain-containing protein n=1 Tax=Novosphingobium sp. AAP83 TaxID=1523425 RepID=UPI0006B9E838|nr:DUF885 family protein [Novosphingobium sp. AAP83]KPF91288.1 Tat pathway signal protein [Novosphingobium sp. AAP83]